MKFPDKMLKFNFNHSPNAINSLITQSACVYLDLLPRVKWMLTEIYAGNQWLALLCKTAIFFTGKLFTWWFIIVVLVYLVLFLIYIKYLKLLTIENTVLATLVTKGRALLQIEKKGRASLGQGRALHPVKTG
jgi:hypothetical protein